MFRADRVPFSVGLSAVLALLAAHASFAQEGAPKGPPPSPVRVAELREEELAPRRKVFGELRSARRTTVAAEESGIVREMLVREGGSAEAGAVIARLDGTRLALERAILDANMSVARANLVERELGVQRAERDLELLRRAAAQGGTNPRELADAESDLAVARAQVSQAQASIAAIERQIGLLSQRIADLDVRAPFAGTVTLRHAEAGAFIAEGGAVVDLSETVQLEGWFDVPQELYSAAVELAARASGGVGAIEIRTATGAAVEGGALRVIPEIDQRARTFHAVVGVDNAAGAFAPGLALEAFVPQGAPQRWMIVPKDALLYQGTAASVYLVDGGVARPVPVRVAFPTGDFVAIDHAAAIVAGLRPGAAVVVEGNERLMPMSPVVPLAGERSKAEGVK